MDCASSGRKTDLTGSVSQMSENGETPGTAEVNPISPENDLTELQEPKLSTDQFYPSLDPTFSSTDEKEKIEKINSNELPPLPHSPVTDVKVSISEHSEAQKEISSSDGDAKSVHFEAERQSEPTKQSKATTDRPNSSESISVPNTPHDGQEREDNPKDVFSTQIDEETLAAAQQRRAQQGKLFSTEEWGPSRPPSVSLHQVVNNRVNEHYKAGLRHLEAQQYERAITAFSKAINLRSNQTIFYVKRAECYLQLCDFQSAILNYRRVCVLEPNNFEHYSRLAFIYFFQGQCLFDQKLYPEALESFSRAAEMRPEVIGYHTRSIACLAALERHGECLALVNKRLEADTGNADLYIMRARLHELFKNTTLCYYDVKDALALEPENSEALEMMERLKIKAKEMKQQAVQLNLVHRHRDALQKISMAIETDPSQPDYHITRGALQRRIGDYNAAIDDYLLAMDKTDHDEESDTYTEAQRQLLLTYNDFAVECFTKGFYEEAVILLNKAIKGEKNEKGLYINRGDCFFRQGNFQFALADYQQALEIDGRDDAIHSRIAVIHNEYGVQDYQDKNYQDAESRFTLAIQHCPKMAQYYISRCRARQVMENISGARQDLLMAMHLDPSSDEITSLMARLFPGKTVKDVLRSDAAVGVRQAFENLTIMSPPVRLAPLNEESREIASAERTFSARAEQEKTDSFDISSTWKPGYTFPSLKACMVERDFNIKIVSGKKRINDQIKNKLHNRKPLNQDGSRILPLSEPVQYTQVGGRAFHTQRITVNAINDSGSNKKSAGWKTFSLGIGLNGIPDKL